MMKLGTQTGSLINHVYSAMNSDLPKVGDGATVLFWSDRKAGTIISVTEKEFVIQLDTATRIDGQDMSDCQTYSYAANPEGPKYTFKRVTRGKLKGEWRENGRKDGYAVCIGTRDQYFDFSF